MTWFVRLAIAAAICATALSTVGTPASAQGDSRSFFLRDPFRPSPPSSFLGFPREQQRRPQPQLQPRRSIDSAPAREPSGGTIYGSSDAADKYRDTQASHYVVVIGDSLADQLAQGLADAFVIERPEVAIVKKSRGSSGLVRDDFYDWPAELPDLLAEENPSAIVVMIGTNDRQVLRDESGAHEVRSDRWRELYIQRIEALVNELKTKGAPIFITGLPSMRLSRLSADLQYINEILREQSLRLGVTFVDIWDGFVDENEQFTTFGPALDGQRRRLRMGDGVHFSRAGARKAAHYVERDLIRLFDQGPRALPIPHDGPEVAPSGRPIAGPVLPLTQPAGPVGPLAGGETPAAGNGDSIATKVLVEGTPVDPMGGRADDFRWPRSKVSIEPPETKGQKLALPGAALLLPDEDSAEAAEAGPSTPAEADPKDTSARDGAELPNVIGPTKNGQRIISVPEANRGR